MLHYIKVPILHYIKVTILHYIKVTILHYIKATILHYIKVTILQYIKVTILHYIKVTILQRKHIEIAGLICKCFPVSRSLAMWITNLYSVNNFVMFRIVHQHNTFSRKSVLIKWYSHIKTDTAYIISNTINNNNNILKHPLFFSAS